jgi:hypothetical protein
MSDSSHTQNENETKVVLKCGCILIFENVRLQEIYLCRKHGEAYKEQTQTETYKKMIKLGIIPTNRIKIIYQQQEEEQ